MSAPLDSRPRGLNPQPFEWESIPLNAREPFPSEYKRALTGRIKISHFHNQLTLVTQNGGKSRFEFKLVSTFIAKFVLHVQWITFPSKKHATVFAEDKCEPLLFAVLYSETHFLLKIQIVVLSLMLTR